MEKLHDYCILMIFQYLSPKDKLNFSKVCTKWQDAIANLGQVLKLRASFNNLYWKEASYINPSELREILQFCRPLLKDITIKSTFFVVDCPNFIQLDGYTYQTKLTILDVLDTLAKVSFNVANLKVFFSENVKDYPIHLLRNLINSNKSIRKLSIEGGNKYRAYLDKYLQLNDLPLSLENVKFAYIFYKTDASLNTFLENASNLKELKLIKVDPVTNKCLRTISLHVTQLKVLHLEKNDENNNISISAMKSISKLINLENFSIAKFTKSFTDDVVEEIAANCQKIKEISLSYCSKISQKGITILISSLPKLQILKLHHLDINLLIEDSKKIQIQSKLKKLKLNFCHNLSVEALCNAIQVMSLLTNLEIFNCFENENIEELAFFIVSTVISRKQNFLVTDKKSSTKQNMIRVFQHEAKDIDFLLCYEPGYFFSEIVKNFATKKLLKCEIYKI